MPRSMPHALVLAIALPTMLSAATLTLQEGTGGYSGCSDSYLSTGGYYDDYYDSFGTAPTLILNTEQYKPN